VPINCPLCRAVLDTEASFAYLNLIYTDQELEHSLAQIEYETSRWSRLPPTRLRETDPHPRGRAPSSSSGLGNQTGRYGAVESMDYSSDETDALLGGQDDD
jgi:hypothetical protein